MVPVTPRVLLLLFLVPLLGLRAADVAMPDEWTVKAWETDDGLPHNSVAGVVQRGDGYLWIATQGGLVRFDGLQFSPVRSALIEGVKASGVVALIEENASTLLLASAQSGLLRLRDGVLSPHPLMEEPGANRKIIQLFREDEDVFWIVFSERDVWRWNRGAVEKIPAVPTSRPSFWPPSFARDRRGQVFLSRGNGVERYERGALVLLDKTPVGSVAIAPSRREGIWVASSRRLMKFVDGQFVLMASPGPWPGTLPPPVLYEDRHEALWVGGLEPGLIRWQKGESTAVAISHVRVTALDEDDEGNLWASTAGGGLNRVQRTRLLLLADDANWTDGSGSVAEDSEGNLWFANRKAIRKITGDRTDVLNDSRWPKRIVPVCADRFGRLWLGAGAELYRGRVDSPEPPILIDRRDSAAVHVIFPAGDGTVWIGRNAGPLQRYHPDGRLELVDASKGYLGKSVRAIGEDSTGRIWVGTEEGRLFVSIGGSFQEEDLRDRHGIRAIHGDTEGDVWVATAGAGLLWGHDGKFVRITSTEGLPDDVVSQILEDDFGWLWFGSRRGIFKVAKEDLRECALGRRSAITPVSFGRADGLSGISAVGSYQPTAWKTRSGQLWFVTRKGLVTTDPARHENGSRPPRVHLDQVVADGRPVPLARPQVLSSTRKLEFQFAAPTFIAPERVRFRYRLDGFDADWVDGGARRAATYPALPPGRYTFTVNASHGDLAWNPVGASIAFEVLPRWWETWWARVAAWGLALVSIVVAVRLWSHKRLKHQLARLEQEQQLERERVRIARDLHDDLGASLTHASMLAEELAEDWPEIDDPKARSAQLAARVRLISRDLDAVVWTVSPKNDSLASLAAYLGHFAEEYFRHTSIECRAHAADGIPPVPLSPEVRHHLFMIAKELLNNVVKHSGARHVDVGMRMIGPIFELVVADNGQGFSLAAAERSGRNGLRNLRARAREAGAALEFESTPLGTVVTLQFRIAIAAETSALGRAPR